MDEPNDQTDRANAMARGASEVIDRRSATDDDAPAPADEAPSWLPSAVLFAAGVAIVLRPRDAVAVVVLLLSAAASPPGVAATSRLAGAVLGHEGFRRGHTAAFADALRDARVEAAMRGTLRGALVDSVVDETLQRSLAVMIREAVADAINDDKFMGLFRNALKDSLKDQDLHRAAIEGSLSALNPFKRRGAAEDDAT